MNDRTLLAKALAEGGPNWRKKLAEIRDGAVQATKRPKPRRPRRAKKGEDCAHRASTMEGIAGCPTRGVGWAMERCARCGAVRLVEVAAPPVAPFYPRGELRIVAAFRWRR